jgi:hypothetical protein
MSEIPGQSGHALPDFQQPVCANDRRTVSRDHFVVGARDQRVWTWRPKRDMPSPFLRFGQSAETVSRLVQGSTGELRVLQRDLQVGLCLLGSRLDSRFGGRRLSPAGDVVEFGVGELVLNLV